MKKVFYFIFVALLTAGIISCSRDDETSKPDDNQQNVPSPSADGSPGEGYVKVDCWNCHGSGNCWQCNGSGKYCSICKGSGNCVKCNGSKICADCNGDSRHTCDRCNGSAKCIYCGGTDVCSQCGGVGYNDYGNGFTIKCGYCSGYGHCTQCVSGKCSKCGGNGIWTCAYCKGDGTCHNCTGSGLCTKCGGDPHCDLCKDGNGKCNSCEGRGYQWEYRPERLDGNDDGSSADGSGTSNNGDTKKKCKYCLGEKRCVNYFSTTANKYYCRGSGECKWCLGKGWVTGFGNEVPCANCDTPGKVSYSGDRLGDGFCHYCHGTGVCSHCNGTGYE